MNFTVLFSIIFVMMTPVIASYERPGMFFQSFILRHKNKKFCMEYYKAKIFETTKNSEKTLVIDIPF